MTDIDLAARPATALDAGRIEELTNELLTHFTSGMLTLMVDLGHRTGLFEAMAEGPATSEELATRAGLQERYVREWLGALVTGGLVEYDAASVTFTLPPEHAAVLTGTGAANLAALAQINTHLGKHLEQVAESFRRGGGVPYEEFRPEFTEVMDAASRSTFDEHLVDDWLPLVPEVEARLRAGARVLDVGCGTGHAVNLMAAAFPASTFVGIDLAEDAIERAAKEARQVGVPNAEFHVADAATYVPDQPFDIVTSFDSIHDQAAPRVVARRIFDALAPGGRYLMVEPAAASELADNRANPLAPWIYGVSTLHCLTVSLALDGEGLGTAWGRQQALSLLAEAGFVDLGVHELPGDPLDELFVATKP